MSETSPSPNWHRFLPRLECRHALQLVYEPNWTVHQIGQTQLIVAGAAEALAYFA